MPMDRSREDLVQNMVESDLEQLSLIHQLVGGGFLRRHVKGRSTWWAGDSVGSLCDHKHPPSSDRDDRGSRTLSCCHPHSQPDTKKHNTKGATKQEYPSNHRSHDNSRCTAHTCRERGFTWGERNLNLVTMTTPTRISVLAVASIVLISTVTDTITTGTTILTGRAAGICGTVRIEYTITH